MNRCFLLCIVLCTLFHTAASAQRVRVAPPDASKAPAITTGIYLYDRDWKLRTDLTASDITVVENGVQRTVTMLNCEPAPPPQQRSAVLTIDVSGSMQNPPGYVDFLSPPDSAAGETPEPSTTATLEAGIDMARAAARIWVDAWPEGWECAVTTFDQSAYLATDFTTDRTRLRQAVTSIAPRGGTNYRAAFLDDRAGAIPVARRARNRPVIVLLTDGVSREKLAANQVVGEAKKINAAVYCICLGIVAPPELRTITSSTGGRLFEAVATQEALSLIYREILNEVLGIPPCQLAWTTELDCTAGRKVVISSSALATSATTSYTLDRAQLPHLTIAPVGVDFGFAAPGVTRDTLVTIRAMQSPVTVTDVSSSHKTVTVDRTGIPFPFTLQPGQSRQFRIVFTPEDSAQVYADVIVQSNACHGNVLPVSGGFPGITPATPTLRLLAPNGGEILTAGRTTDITWQGTLPGEVVSLSYSIDGGENWAPVTDKAAGSSYNWLVPTTPSTTCLMQVVFIPDPTSNARSDTVLTSHDRSVGGVAFGATGALASIDDGGMVHITDQPDVHINTGYKGWHVRFSNDGRMLVTASGHQADLWETTTGTHRHTLLHDHEVYTVEFDPSDRRVLTASGDETARIWNTETGTEMFILEPPDEAGIVASACFDASGNRVFTGHENGTYSVWNALSGGLLQTFPAHTGMILAIDNNPAGPEIATGGEDNTVRVWNGLTGTLVSSFAPNSGMIHSLAFNATGQLLAAGCEDGTVKIWDVPRKELILTLIAHGDVVTGVSFAPDGQHLATSSYDSTVKIWDVAYRGVMLDTSDAYWTIAEPLLRARDIDFGEVYVTAWKDTLIDDFFINEGIVPVYIDSVRIEGADQAAFTDDVNTERIILPAHAFQFGSFRFTPPAVGPYEAYLSVYYHGRRDRYTLRGRGIRPPIEISKREIDFGRVQVDTYKDTTDIVLRNISTIPVTVATLAVTEPNSALFTLESPFEPFTLAPGTTHTVTLRFAPAYLGEVSSVLAIGCRGVDIPLDVRLFGTGTGQAVVETGPPAVFSVACAEQSTRRVVTIVNPRTTASLTIVDIAVEGAHADDFAIVGGGTLPFTIAPGAPHDVDILCTPAQAGIRQAELVLTTDGSTGDGIMIRRLHAVRDTVAFSLSTPTVRMEGLREYEARRDSVGILNTGTLPLSFAVPVAMEGFAIDSVAPNPIAPGGSGMLYIRYSGGQQGTVEQQVFRADHACGTLSIDLYADVQQWPAVLAGTAAVEAVEFAPLPCPGAHRDTVLTLLNSGPAPVAVLSAGVAGPHAGDFRLTPPDDLTLDPGEFAEFLVRCAPSAVGVRTAELVLRTTVNDSALALPLSAVQQQPSFALDNTLALAAVAPLATTTATTTLHNTGTVPLSWSTPPPDGLFAVVSIDPAVTPPGGSSVVTIAFSGAAQDGTYRGQFPFRTMCNEEQVLRVEIPVQDIPLVHVEIGSAAGASGEVVDIPVYVRAPSSLTGIRQFGTTLRFNSSLLVPEAGTPAGTVVDGERRIPLSIPGDATPDGPAMVLRFRVALGNDSTTVLRLDSILAEGGTVYTERVNGLFTLTDFCREGGPRLFDGNSAAGLAAPRPSPATADGTHIPYSLVEAGRTMICLVDARGRTITTLMDGPGTPGSYTLAVPTGTLQAGVYFIVLRTPTQVFLRRLDIAR